MKIGEFANRVGIAPSTLRYYEDIGLLSDVPRVNQQRHYPKHYIPLVQLIQIAKRAGFTLDEIQEMMQLFQDSTAENEPIWKPRVQQKLQEVESAIAKLQQMQQILFTLLTCDDDDFDLEVIMEEDLTAFNDTLPDECAPLLSDPKQT